MEEEMYQWLKAGREARGEFVQAAVSIILFGGICLAVILIVWLI